MTYGEMGRVKRERTVVRRVEGEEEAGVKLGRVVQEGL